MKNYIKVILLLLSLVALSQASTYPAPPKCTKPNEIYKAKGTKCQPTCDNRNPRCTKDLVSGCFCKDGYIRHKGSCILIAKCPLVCGVNEVIAECPPSCPPERSCDQEFQGYEYSCAPPPEPIVCSPKCICQPGFIRNDKNQCVKLENCCSDPNAEVVECPNPCPATCDNPSSGICTVECQRKGCQCKSGYILHNGKCIKYNQCPNPICSGRNEVYVSCKNPCPDTCESITSLEPQPVCSLPFPCPGGCNCLSGYVRDQNNVCVLPEDCNVECKGVNQTLNKCPAYCTFVEDCQSYISGIIRDCAAPPIEPIPCRPRCECTEGNILVFGECKNPNECCLDPNASVVGCPSECPRTCNNLLETDTVCNKTCKVRGCQCNEGYVLDSNSKCIKPEDCPPLPCPENENYNKCPGFCTFDPDCLSYVDGIFRQCSPPPPGVIIPCRPRCRCNEGFLRIDGTCQLPYACCGPNQEVVDCPNPCPATCDNYDLPKRSCGRLCKQRGCTCKSGYVRDSNNNCIKIDQCPKKNKCTKANEIFQIKGTKCQPTCDDRNPKCTKDVVSGCFCKDGYIRNRGECIPINECPKKCPVNEEFLVCGPACQRTCDERTIACKAKCRPECHCKKGYIREVVGEKCIKIEHCPDEYSDYDY